MDLGAVALQFTVLYGKKNVVHTSLLVVQKRLCAEVVREIVRRGCAQRLCARLCAMVVRRGCAQGCA